MKNVFDMKSPNGELYDDTIVSPEKTYYLRDGKIVEVEEMPWQELNCWGYEKPEDVPMPTHI